MTEMNKEVAEFQVGDDGTFLIDDDNLAPIEAEVKEEVEVKSKTKDKPVEDDKEYFEVDDEALEEDDEPETTEDDKEVSKDSEDNPYFAFVKDLVDKEVLLGLSEEEIANIKDDEDLAKAVEKTITNVSNQWIEEADNKSYGAVTHFLNGGTPEEFIKSFNSQSNVLDYSEEQLQDEKVQRKIVESYYKKTSPKMSEKRLQKMVDNTVEIDGEDEVLEMYKELKDLDKQDKESFKIQAKKKEEEVYKQRVQFENTLRDNTLNVTEFIPGKKINKDVKEKVLGGIKPTWDKINKDLSKYAPILSYLDYYGLLDGKFDKVLREVETKQTSKLADVLRNTSLNRKGDNKAKDSERQSIIEIARASLRKK